VHYAYCVVSKYERVNFAKNSQQLRKIQKTSGEEGVIFLVGPKVRPPISEIPLSEYRISLSGPTVRNLNF